LILLVFPFQAELDAFSPRSPDRKETLAGGIRVFRPDSQPAWRLAVCGQGKVEAALACQILVQAMQPDHVLLVGSATALDPSLSLGDIVVADCGIEYDFGSDPVPRFKSAHAFPLPIPNGVAQGAILSGDRNVFLPAEKQDLFARYAAKALAWEGAGFHRFLRRSAQPGWEIRQITETAGAGQPTLAELRDRLQSHAPALRTLVGNLLRALSA
jgi:nucleoside phosphorylase